MKRASAQEAAAERCRLATLPLLASPHRPDVFPEAFRIAAEAQHAARLGVEAVAGAFEDEAPLFDPAYDDRPNANVAAPPSNGAPATKTGEISSVHDLCAPLPRRNGLFRRRGKASPNKRPGQKLAMKYFDRAGRFRGAHKSRTWCFLGVFDGRGTHKSGTCPHAGGGQPCLLFAPKRALRNRRIPNTAPAERLPADAARDPSRPRFAGPPCARFACSGILQSAGLSNACARSG
mgnify:CR=1 FL=1